MPKQSSPSPDQLAAALRSTVSTLVRATRSSDRLAAIPATVLDLLDRNGAMTTAELAARRGVRHQTMAVTVRDLSDAGYLGVGPDPADARKRVLRLTTAGRNALESDRHDRVSVIAEAITDTLSDDELHILADALPVLDRIAARIADNASPADSSPVTGAR
jgi:DNA-binding MarR family transcriptional regulator